MTDPLYGDNPLDLNMRWYQVSRPPLIPDAEYQAWQAVITGHGAQLLESSWLVRWRAKNVSTAEGVHLSALAAEFGFLRPAGWSEDRFAAAAQGIDGAVLTNRPPSATIKLAQGLTAAQPGQAFEIGQAGPLVYVVVFYGVTDDEAETYCSVMDYGRPKGVRMVCAWSNVSKANTFVLDTSEVDGPAILAQAFGP